MTLRLLTAGESHGPALVAVLEGLPAGLALDVDLINRDLARRQHGYGAGPRMKLESDQVQILSGVMAGLTTGGPLALQVQNSDHARWKGKPVTALTTPRPGHADLAGAVKYGYNDLRPSLERASARETAARVAAGAVCRAYLASFDISVQGYVAAIGEVSASLDSIPQAELFALSLQNEVNCPDAAAAEQMRARIRRAMDERDTLGGVIEVLAFGLPVGLGSFAQWDRKLDAHLGRRCFRCRRSKGLKLDRRLKTAACPAQKRTTRSAWKATTWCAPASARAAWKPGRARARRSGCGRR